MRSLLCALLTSIVRPTLSDECDTTLAEAMVLHARVEGLFFNQDFRSDVRYRVVQSRGVGRAAPTLHR